jgi:hypothetical protein
MAAPVPEAAMSDLALTAFAFASLLAAQQGEPGREPPPDPAALTKKAAAEAAAKPIRFTSFPVAEQLPLDVAAAVKDGIEALLALQEGDVVDQWPYEGVYRQDRGNLPVGYRVGGTAIVCRSLVAAPGYGDDARRQAAVERGIAFILKTLAESPRMSIGFIGRYDVRGWGHIYALQLFLELRDAGLEPGPHKEAIAERIKWLCEALVALAIPERGGWNYSLGGGYQSPNNRASTFMTPAALQALFHAKARGQAVPDQVLDAALAALERARSEPGGYAYGAPAESQNGVPAEQLSMMDRVPSSAARAALVETTLLLAGRGDAARHRRAVERFFEHWDDLAVRKSQEGTHIPPYGIAPYYFLFGHVYCAQAIEQLDDADKRAKLRAKMRAVLAKSREEGGSWNDRQFGRSGGYGTALALLTLHMERLPKPFAWTPNAGSK